MTATPTAPGHVWVDGRILDAATPVLTAFDRGFQLGDGIFETLRARANHPTELDAHVARLRRSAAGLGFALPDDIEATLGNSRANDVIRTEDRGGAVTPRFSGTQLRMR